MPPHSFLLSPGYWEGEGTITLSMTDEVLPFQANWIILPQEGGKIYFTQEVAIQGVTEKRRNQFCLLLLSLSTLEVRMENDVLGKITGSGLMTPDKIAWEFRRSDQELEGFEVYEKQEDGSYKMRAEFSSGVDMRTHILGHLHPHL